MIMSAYKSEMIPKGEYFSISCSTARAEEYVPKFHTHDHYVIYFFLRGNATYVFDNFAHHLVPGDVVIVPRGVMHCALFEDPDAPYERLIARICPAAVKNMQVPGFSAVKRIGEMAANQEFCHSIAPKSLDWWKEVFLKYTRIASPSPEAQLAMLGRLTVLVATVLSQKPKMPLASDSVAEKIISYIDSHFSEELSLEKISGEFFMSPSRLSHIFTAHADMSVHRYITIKRIDSAKSMLKRGMSPSEVSSLCGYQDYSCFYRAFVKETGTSPRSFAEE